MDKFEKDLLETNLLHKPLKLAEDESFEHNQLKNEKITKKSILEGKWKHFGLGEMLADQYFLHLTSPARFDTYPEDFPQDGDYTSFGKIGGELSIPKENWEQFTQLKLVIQANCKNLVNPAITLSFQNEGKIKIPDVYNREGHHVINLKNHEKKTYLVDLSNLPRDEITKLSITFDANGSYMNLPGSWDIVVEQIILEKNENASPAKGWNLPDDLLSYSHLGYPVGGKKTLIASALHIGHDFVIKNVKNQEVVFQGQMQALTTTVGSYSVADFSDFKEEGNYILEVGKLSTQPFKIGSYESILKNSLLKSLNFIFCERCGMPVSGIHGTCHQDVYAEFEGNKIPFNGGWHDAGDLSQQLVQTAEVTLSCFELANQLAESEPIFAHRLMEEGEWGLDFILKTRLGQGFRMTSAGVSRWTDNQIGTMDDAKARIHNSPYDNFLITGILAKICLLLPKKHELLVSIVSILEEDYQDALTGFENEPFVHDPIFWEHTYSTSKSLYLATMIWSNALMTQLTGKSIYREELEKYLPDLLDCQERQGISLFDGRLLKGMFYRDESKKIFQHFNHQAREHLYAQALTEAKIVLKAEKWQEQINQSMKDYGDYLKYLMTFIAPYPMIASGIYHDQEAEDELSFRKQHLLIGEEAFDNYKEQLLKGEKVAEHYFIKRFPVWFSFRGNNAILLSMGESAAILGSALSDRELLDIAYQQMQWVIGKNPFAQSLMFGEGHNYPHLYTVSSGEMIGELPVGIQTFENEDQPYWSQFNNATYKEVWVGLAGKWLSLAAQLID